MTDEYAVLFGDKFQLGDVAPLPEFKDEILFAAVGDFRCLECRFDKGIVACLMVMVSLWRAERF